MRDLKQEAINAYYNKKKKENSLENEFYKKWYNYYKQIFPELEFDNGVFMLLGHKFLLYTTGFNSKNAEPFCSLRSLSDSNYIVSSLESFGYFLVNVEKQSKKLNNTPINHPKWWQFWKVGYGKL